jgi:hypothetical protein
VAVFEEVLVGGHVWKIGSVLLLYPVVNLANGLLLARQEIKQQNGNDFAVAKRGLAATANRYRR